MIPSVFAPALRQPGPLRIVVLPLLAVLGLGSAEAAINSIASGDAVLGNRSLNLIKNGSFENSNWSAVGAGLGQPSWVLAGTGTTLNGGVVQVPDDWTTLGGPLNYAVWGNDSSLAGPGLRGSAPLPHGTLGFYLGNQGTFVSPAPSFGANGVITFASPPVFTHIDPPNYTPGVRIEQTVIGLNVNAAYDLEFWTSGEDAAAAGMSGPGLLELGITGEAPIYLATPYSPADANLGDSQRYYIQFQPTTPNVTFSFINHGHLLLTGFNSEGVIDDVILNVARPTGVVPESRNLLAGAAVGGLLVVRTLRRRR